MKKESMIQQSDLVSAEGSEKREGEFEASAWPRRVTGKEIQQAFDSLEEQGLIRKTGELRRGKAGALQPVYVATTVAVWLEETGLMEDFELYLASVESKPTRAN